MARPAAKGLHRAMKRVMARAEERSLGYASTVGEPLLRLSFGHPWCEATEDAVKWLGDEVHRMAAAAR